MNGHAPDVLVLIVAEAGAGAGTAALGEHVRLVADDQFNFLIFVHAVEVDGLLQVLVHEAKVEVEHDLHQRDLFIVVFTDVEMILIHHQNARAGAGALRVDAEGVLCAVILVTNERSPCPFAVILLLAADDGEGLHGVLIRHIIRRTGADGDIELVVELHDLPDGAAVDAVLEMEGGVIEQVFLRCDYREALRIVRRLRRINLCLKLTLVVLRHAADDQLVLIDAHAADTGGDAFFKAFAEILCGHAVDHLAVVRLGIDLPDLGRVIDRAAEVELAVIFHSIAEVDVILHSVFASGLGHQDLHGTGLGVDLDQCAAGNVGGIVSFRREEITVIEDVQNSGQQLGIILVAKANVHQLNRLAQGIVVKTRVDPLAIGHGRPGIRLAAAAGIVAVAAVGCDLAVVDVIHDAVVSSAAINLGVGGYLRMGNLFGGLSVFGCIGVGKYRFGIALTGKRHCGEHAHCHCQAKQDAQHAFFHFHFHYPPSDFEMLLSVIRVPIVRMWIMGAGNRTRWVQVYLSCNHLLAIPQVRICERETGVSFHAAPCCSEHGSMCLSRPMPGQARQCTPVV